MNFVDYQNLLLTISDDPKLHAYLKANPYLTLKEFCELYGVKYGTLYAKRIEPEFAAIRIGNEWLVKNTPETAAKLKCQFKNYETGDKAI